MSAAPVVIRLIGPSFGRWAELHALLVSAFAFMDGRIDPPSSLARLSPEGLAAKVAEETAIAAFLGDRLAGCVFLAPRDDHFYLGKLAVAPELKGAGIGAALLRAAEGHAVQAGRPAIELQTRIELIENQRWFQDRGFVETARTAHPGYAHPTSITYRKALA